MTLLLWSSVALPVAAALAVRVAPRAHGAVAVAGALAAAVPSWALLAAAGSGETARTGFAWLEGGGLDAGLRLDGLSAAMTATVATVGLVVVVFAAGYFAGDARRASALAGLLAFLAAMQGLVLADGYLTLLVFWELVGAASARLIAYSREDATAPAGAVRAFLTTRTADIGLYLAVLALFTATGSLAFGAERPDGALGALVGLGLVVAAMGKSAQAPLQTWLSAAMAGPTPVSALLHSATMVAAGVYLLARSHELLAGWPLQAAGWVGALTAVAGAAIALAQSDLKRVLAGSTTSQLGLMFVGVAAGGPAVGIFHLVAHAAGKAGMFLAAGIFQHNRHTTALDGLTGADVLKGLEAVGGPPDDPCYGETLGVAPDGFDEVPAQDMISALAACGVPPDIFPGRPILTGDPGGPNLFSYTGIYGRGALTAHALRLAIGDAAFFALARDWTTRYANGNAATVDFMRLAEDVSGQDLDGLFDAWLFELALPELDLS